MIRSGGRAGAHVAAAVLASACVAGAADEPPRAPAPLPPALAAVLARGDPLALADTTLPRLAALMDEGRGEALREALAPWPVDRRVAAYAFLAVGAPYVLGPLGEEAPPDTDPLVRFDVFDCATLNLTAEALAHAGEAGGVRAAMKRANYRGGVVSYDSRLHFTTDRLDESPYDRDITRTVGGDSVVVRRVTLNRRADGSRWIPIDWERPRDVAYLPIGAARDFAALHRAGRLPDAVGVAFVEERRLADGLDVVHETLLWRGEVLLHGSSRIGRVVAVPWREFLDERGGLYDGVVLFEYR